MGYRVRRHVLSAVCCDFSLRDMEGRAGVSQHFRAGGPPTMVRGRRHLIAAGFPVDELDNFPPLR